MSTEAIAETDSISTQRQSRRVLLVDDEKALRFHSRMVLEAFGLDVTEAESGEQAIAHLDQDHFDLVLLDVRMPGIDGFETCREMRRLMDRDLLPIVIVTGLEDLGSIEQAYQVGATDFTTKPINWPVLKNRIRYLMRSRQTSLELQATEGQRRALIDSVPDTILRLVRQGRVLDIKPAKGETVTLTENLLVGKEFWDGLSETVSRQVRQCLQAVLEIGGTQQCEFEWTDGQQFHYYEVRMVAANTDDIVVLLRDCTDRHRAEQKLRQMAFYDELTGLPKTNLLSARLVRCLDEAGRGGGLVAMVRLEMANLTNLTDMMNRESADELLRLWTDRLVKVANERTDLNVMVARTEGAQFSVLVSGLKSRLEFNDFISHLAQCMEMPLLIRGYELQVSVRIGSAVYPDDDIDGSQLQQKAGMAVEELRRCGRLGANRYNDTTRERTLGRISMAKELKTAIEHGELHLDYQPKVNSMTCSLVGVEALVRWNSDLRGAVPPVEFIPLAEENGLILPLGEWVLSEACRQASAWRANGCGPIPVAVNFSGHQFNQRDLLQRISQILKRHSVDSTLIEVEMTESVAMDHSSKIMETLQELRHWGMRTAIDDFGTGYSSLSSLRNLPFSILKIDRNFIRHITSDHSAAQITSAIIFMGHALGMEVVAEGVEDKAQLEFLRKHQCDVIQGYYTGRPTDARAITELALADK
jgi:PAS domain S-box-containing protein